MRRGRRVPGQLLAIGVVAISALTANPVPTAVGQQVFSRSTSNVAPGVTLTKMKVSGPNQVRILTIDPSLSGAIDVTTARRTLPGFSRTSEMARDLNANAAVNGDFGLYPGRPAHAYAEDAEIKQTSILGNSGKSYSTRQDGTASFIDSPNIDITVEQLAIQNVFSIQTWNAQAPKAGEIAAWSKFGGTMANPTKGLCAARLKIAGPAEWAPDQEGVARDYTVDTVQCGSSAMHLSGGIVIGATSGGSRRGDITGLIEDETVRLTWSFGWAGVADSMGGSPILVADGKLQVSKCGTYLCSRQPRTAVGFKENGDVLLVVIDGRQPGWSVGMTLVAEARFMLDQGATYAMNLDGGGSATMWVNGKIKNRPADGAERAVSSAIVVLPHSDDGEPILHHPIPESDLMIPSLASIVEPPQPASRAAAQDAWKSAITDPGSTGGLLDSMDHAGRTLNPAEQDWLRRFRMAQHP